jgi:hypothetical protein
VLKTIGETEGSGATIAFGDAGEGNLARANWFSNKITLNVAAIDSFGQETSAGPGARFAGVVAHEGTHLSGAFRFWEGSGSVIIRMSAKDDRYSRNRTCTKGWA